eukprot:SM000053S17464  [mRNA]  locus=s53:557220:557973:- [translate_table: standard]
MAASELACTYAALILHDDGIPITADKISTLVKAAGVSVESYWPMLFAKLLDKRSVEDLITNVGSGVDHPPFPNHIPSLSPFYSRSERRLATDGRLMVPCPAAAARPGSGGGGSFTAAPAATGGGGGGGGDVAPAEEKKEEKKEEEKEESDDDMGFSLFD